MLHRQSATSASMAVIATWAGMLLTPVIAAASGTPPPCLGLGSTQVMDVAVKVVAFDIGGDVAATLDDSGLTIWTFRGDGYPVRRGRWLAPRGFAGFETYLPYLEVDPRGWAYIGGWETGFFVIDLQNPDQPEIVYESIPDVDRSLENAFNPSLLGTTLFLQTESLSRFVFLDVENPMNPRPTETGLPPGVGYLGVVSQYLVRSRAYQNVRGPIEIWDVTNLNDPQPVSTISESHGFMPGVMWAGGTTAFVSRHVDATMWDERTSLGVLDLSDPANPGYIEMHEFADPPLDWIKLTSVVFDESLGFAAAWIEDGFYERPVLDVVDLGDPLSPSIEKRITIPTNDLITGLGVRGGHVYAALRDGGMRVFTADGDLTELWRIPSVGPTTAMAFHRGRAVIPHGHDGLEIHDVNDHGQLTFRGRLPLEHPVFDLEISGDLAAVRGHDSDHGEVVYLVNLEDPDEPRLESEIRHGQPLGDIAIDGDLLITCDAFTYAHTTDHKWEIYDISHAAEPILLAEADAGYCTSLDIRNDLLALNSSGRSTLFDLTDPMDPIQLSWVLVGGDDRSSVALTDEVMVIGTPWSIKGWDITDPSNPVEVPEIRDLGVFPTWLRSFGNRIVGTSHRWRTSASLLAWLIDLDDPRAPVARSITTPRISGIPVLDGGRLWIPSPPFVEGWSTECSAPDARFEVETSWREMWLHSTTTGVVDVLIWDFGDGTIEEQDLRSWTGFRDRDHSHSTLHRYESPGRYSVELTAVGPDGVSVANRIVVVETPSELRGTRPPLGRVFPDPASVP